MIKRLNRRTFIRGVSGVALGLPLLEIMQPRKARAASGEDCRRICFVFKPNGDEIAARFTQKGETNFQFGDFLAPLEPYREDLLILERLHKRFGELSSNERADNHQQGGSSLAPWPSGSGSFPVGGANRTVGWVLGPSADHAMGERVLAENPTMPHRSLNFRVGSNFHNIWNVHSHGGPAGRQNPLEPETNPYNAYADLFDGLQTGNEEIPRAVLERFEKRASALDLVLEEMNSLQTKVGALDRQRIEQHADALRDIERALVPPGSAAASSCAPPNVGQPINVYRDENWDVVGRAFFKIIAMAYACDLTRVVNFNWAGNTSGRIYADVEPNIGHHDISHESNWSARIRAINTRLWTQSTELYRELQAIPEGTDGKTVWDNTLIVHWNELSEGYSHDIRDQLVILAGGAGGHFRMGRYLDFQNNAAFADMLVSCFHYLGFNDVNRFGDERLSDGRPLAGLTA